MQTLHSINKIAGRDIEITIRGDRSFTFSFDGIDNAAKSAICDFFINDAMVEVAEDEECGTFIYCDLY